MIIKELLNRNVKFIVVQYENYLTKAKFMQMQEWEVIVPEEELKKTKGIFLVFSAVFSKKCKSRILSLSEITEFKELLSDHFHCAVKNKDGAVYEPINHTNINQSFINKQEYEPSI